MLIPGPGGLIPNKMRVVGLVDPKYFYRLVFQSCCSFTTSVPQAPE